MNIDETLAALELLDQRKTFEKWRYFLPVPKQEEFLAAGGEGFQERLLMAGNGCGKTETAAYEVSRHLTGDYPPWWKGFRFDKPARVWIAGTSDKAVAEAAQTKLLGPPGNKELRGSGVIPREAIFGEPRPSRGYPDAVASFQVRCKINGKLDESAISRVVVKTYAQDREDWQGGEIDVLWPDEEPPEDLYTEGRARLRGRGLTLMTFTPLKGMSDVVLRYLEQPHKRRMFTKMGINDALWYTEEERQSMIDSYPMRERQARAFGDPMMGVGKVFLTPIEDLIEPTIPLDRVPVDWAKLWAVDFGGGSETAHPFAAVLLAWDREEVKQVPDRPALAAGCVGTIHVLHEIRMTNALIVQHADAMKRVAANVPVAWPHDGHVNERDGGKSTAELYRKYGLNMLDTHATHVSGGFSTYAGITDLDTYMQARQFKVGAHCTMWIGEYDQYHYDKKNLLVKVRDDLMSATRIGHIMRRRARPGPTGTKFVKPLRPTSRGDIDPWTGRSVQGTVGR